MTTQGKTPYRADGTGASAALHGLETWGDANEEAVGLGQTETFPHSPASAEEKAATWGNPGLPTSSSWLPVMGHPWPPSRHAPRGAPTPAKATPKAEEQELGDSF